MGDYIYILIISILLYYFFIGIEFRFDGKIGDLEIRYDPKTERKINNSEKMTRNLIAIVDGQSKNALSSHLRHIGEMFEHMGYTVISGTNVTSNSTWDAMWYHEYSYSYEPYASMIRSSTSQHVINHVPGSGYYTSKVALATCGLSIGVPQAFQLPQQKEEFLKYSGENRETLWVQKDNTHRNIKIRSVEEMNLDQNNSFVQKFVENPLLIDNRKFDIGIYTVITSLLPLRVYIYDGDVLIRFCPEDYYPMDVENVNKYVVGDDYTPIWEIESLAKFFNTQKMSFKHTIDSYLGTKNIDSKRIWNQISDIIAEVFRLQQSKMLLALQSMKSNARIFELSRFDFVVDEDLNVFLMEANMSPNLSSGHFKQNQIMYEKVLMSIFSMVGISKQLTSESETLFNSRNGDQNPIVSDRDINLPLKFCVEDRCQKCDEAMGCQLCGHCMTKGTRKILEEAYLEHINRRHMRRLSFNYNNNNQPLTKEDHLQTLWLHTKCELDHSWC